MRRLSNHPVPPDESVAWFSVGAVRLDNGSLVTRVRFEMWWTMAAIVTFALAITAYGLLRRHWRRENLEQPDPERPVREARWVLACGILAILGDGIRVFLESRGVTWIHSITLIPGAGLEIATLFFVWVSILQCWRRSRPLYREPLVWIGFALAIVPPFIELLVYQMSWQPPA